MSEFRDTDKRHLSDEHKLALAEGRERARQERMREREDRQARGVDYEDIVPMTAEDRAAAAPNIADVAAKAAVSAGQNGGGSTAEIAAAVAAAVAAVMSQQPAPMQGPGGSRPLPPAVLKRRGEAWDQMVELVDKIAHDGSEMPIYELLVDLYVGEMEMLIEATRIRKGPEGARNIQTRIRFSGIPNEGMLPINGPAKQVHKLFLEAIGGKTPDLGDQSYNAYASRPRHPAIVGESREVPLMGQPRPMATGTVEVLIDTPEEEVTYVGPPKILGTIQPETPSLF